IIAGLARAARHDIERAAKALESAIRPRIHVVLATSDIHLQHKLRISHQQCLEQAANSVRLARTLCDDVEFSPEDATRTDPEFLFQVLEAVIEAGATTLNIPDTVGYTVPAEFGDLIRNIRERVRGAERATISHEPDAGRDYGNPGAAEQSDYRTQRVRARGRNPSGWHAQESADL